MRLIIIELLRVMDHSEFLQLPSQLIFWLFQAAAAEDTAAAVQVAYSLLLLNL
jgi:hypothetical protein